MKVNGWDPAGLDRFRADELVQGFRGGFDAKASAEELEHVATLLPAEWVGEAAVGTPDRCAAKILEQFDLGADSVILHGATPTELEPVIDDPADLTPGGHRRPPPFALVHGDYRLDNLMFPLTGDGVCALDRQTVTVAPPVRDVAYFLGNSLLTGQRRAEEEQIVDVYHRELLALGVDGYDLADCWLDHRHGHPLGRRHPGPGPVLAPVSEPPSRSGGLSASLLTR